MKRFRVVVLASGSGTNLQAILDRVHGSPAIGAREHRTSDGGQSAEESGRQGKDERSAGAGDPPVIEVVGVASDKPEARALERAREAGIATGEFPSAEHATRAERDLALLDWIESAGAELVVLAGYMQLLSAEFVGRLAGRVINVHPSLLPSFPGLDAIGQALAAGVRVTGVTVHLVDEGVDTGPILLQRAVEVPEDRDRSRLEREIHQVEHELLPEAIRLIAAGELQLGAREARTRAGSPR